MKENFSHELGKGAWFQDDSSALHLLFTLFLLLLHQLHLRSSGIRSRRLGTPLSALSPGHGYQVTEASSLFACRYLEPSNKRIIPQTETFSKKQFQICVYCCEWVMFSTIMRFEFQGYLIPLWILALPHHSCFTEPTFGVNHWYKLAFPCGSVVKNPPANTGDMGLIPGSRRFPWERKWQHILIFLPGKILWTEEPRGLQSVGSQRVGYDRVNLYLITNVLSFWSWFIKIM